MITSSDASNAPPGGFSLPCNSDGACQMLPGSRCIASKCQLPGLKPSAIEYRWQLGGIARCEVEFRTSAGLPGNPLGVEAVVQTDFGGRETANPTLWASSPQLAETYVSNCSTVKSVTVTEMSPVPELYVGVRPLYHAPVRDLSSVQGGTGTADVSAGNLIAKYPQRESDFTGCFPTSPANCTDRKVPPWSFRVALADLQVIGEGGVIECKRGRSGTFGIPLKCRGDRACVEVLGDTEGVFLDYLAVTSEDQCRAVAYAMYKEAKKSR